MRNIIVLRGVAIAALGLALLLSSSAYAGQPVGDLSQQPATYTDTVVNPHGPAIQAPVNAVHWRGWRRGWGYRGWHGPYYRPYRYGTYYYGYRPPRCWWNGYRWRSIPRRAIIY